MDRIEEIRARLEKITPGPWKKHGNSVVETTVVETTRGIIADVPVPTKGGTFDCQANAAFIVAAPEDVAFLLSQLEQASGLLQRAAVELDSDRDDVSDIDRLCVEIVTFLKQK